MFLFIILCCFNIASEPVCSLFVPSPLTSLGNLSHSTVFNRERDAQPRMADCTSGQRSSTFLQRSHRRVGRIFHCVLLLAEAAGDTGDWLWWDLIQKMGRFVHTPKLSTQHERSSKCKQRTERNISICCCTKTCIFHFFPLING